MTNHPIARILATCLLGVFLISLHNPVHANLILVTDVVPIEGNTVSSGNGSLDLRMFTFSGSTIGNDAAGFNGDNGNTNLPQGGGADTSQFAESYITTAGELQDFYVLNFSDGNGGSTISELALFIDLNETGAEAQATNLLDRLDIVVNPDTVNGDPDPSGDVTGAQQEAVQQLFTGGDTVASLDQQLNLPVVLQGAGFADYVVFTGVNIFELDEDDVVLFNISASSLNNGAEEIFISGTFAGVRAVPEPSSIFGWALGMAWLGSRRKR